MTLWTRWSIVIAVALTLSAGCWAALQFLAGLDTGAALSIAAAPLTIVLAVSAPWADIPRRTPKSSDAGTDALAVTELHQSLGGHQTLWRARMRTLDALDLTVDARHALMQDVESTLHETLRLVAERLPDAPILDSFAAIAHEAHQWANYRVYLDGGKTFDALTNGCRQVLELVDGVLRETWTDVRH